MRASFLPAALKELHRAAENYDKEAPDLGDDFVDEVERMLRNLVERPELGASGLYGTRRIPLRRYPYNLVYRVREEIITIVAVAHHRRRPDYWRKRLR